MTAVMRFADARLNASSISSSSIRWSFVGRARRLDDEDVAAAHVLGDLDLALAVAEAADLGLPERHAELLADRRRERPVGAPGEYLDLVFHRARSAPSIPASWAGRSRTFAAGSKVRCLTSLATAQG